MSSFQCEKCGAVISDTERGYVTFCKHYPKEHLEVTCTCGVDITSMKCCNRKANKWFCKTCGKNITRKKYNQLIDYIKNS